MKSYFFMENWGRDQNIEVKGYVLVVKVQFFPFFLEKMKERGSMYEHFPLCGSARAAVRGRLLTKPFSDQNRVSENVTFLDFFGGCFLVLSKRFR